VEGLVKLKKFAFFFVLTVNLTVSCVKVKNSSLIKLFAVGWMDKKLRISKSLADKLQAKYPNKTLAQIIIETIIEKTGA
jgi:3-hydroxyisobutyrate dehydrogenase-like beta-hydroxyacid dehydrogenase